MRFAAIFPGQGSQAVGMGGAIAARFPLVAELFARAERVLGYDLLALTEHGPAETLRETRFGQPAIFVVNYALAAVAARTLLPVASAGHSFAEFCSLTLAGAIGFESALELVAARALEMQAAADAAPGSMAAVLGLDVEGVRQAVMQARSAGRVQLANFNSPAQIVISGDVAAVESASQFALAAGAKRVIALNVSGAWHSELMAPARERFGRLVEQTAFSVPSFTVISGVDARPYVDVAAIRRNLAASVTSEVRWHLAAERLLTENLDLIVEFGGTRVLAPLMKRLPGAPRTLYVGDETSLEALRAELAGTVSV